MQQKVDCVLCRQRIAELEARVARLTAQNEKLSRERKRDPLTGIANRRSIGERIAVIQRQIRNLQSNSMSIFFIDIDHFKKVNDTYGHAVGDKVLIAVAKTLCSPAIRVRAVGRGRSFTPATLCEEKRQLSAGRWGGEEFIAVAVNIEDPGVLAEMIRNKVREIRIPEYPDLRVTVSIGYAQMTVHTYVIKEELLRQADKAMYEAKQSGRDRVVMAEMPQSDYRQMLVV